MLDDCNAVWTRHCGCSHDFVRPCGFGVVIKRQTTECVVNAEGAVEVQNCGAIDIPATKETDKFHFNPRLPWVEGARWLSIRNGGFAEAP